MKSDGFRGKYGIGWVTEKYYYRLPFVLKELFGFEHVVVAHDPRSSSPLLYNALVEGAKASGLAVTLAGMMPTPMLAKWVHDNGLYGLMVTASHNPSDDNGIKFIGFELDKKKRGLAALLLESSVKTSVRNITRDMKLNIKEAYQVALKKAVNKQHHYCLIDAANGAWGDHIDILEEVGFKIDRYDCLDKDINASGCVNMHLQSYPLGYDYTVAFDGDGDRLLILKEGILIDGDDMLMHLSNKQQLLVGTILSNASLEVALGKKGMRFLRTDVGDQWVHKALKAENGRYGGETCGHVIDLHWMGYSDPVYMLCHLMDKGEIKPLDKVYQYNFNLPSDQDIEALRSMLTHPKIRLVIRESNTEPLIRVMLEGDQGLVMEVLKRYSLNSASI